MKQLNRSWRTLQTVLGSALLAATGLINADPFTPGNLVVYRVGDGSAALTNASTQVFLDEYTVGGSLVQSISMPTTASGSQRQLAASGTATSEGLLTRSVDGACLVLTGYGANLGVVSVSGTTSATVSRVIGLVNAAGVADTTTALTDAASANNVRGAAAESCTGQLWVAGATGGIRYVAAPGNTTSTQLSTTPTNLRQPLIAAGQLYVSTASGSAVRIGTVGTGLPTVAGQFITTLPSFPVTGSPYAFAFADLDAGIAGVDTLYVADDGAQALRKYSLVTGAWTLNGTVGGAADLYRGITISTSGSTVTIYAVRGTSTNTLVSLVDSSGFNGAFVGTPTTLVSAAANNAFRGVAFAPVALNAPPTITASTGLSRQQGSPVSNSTIATVTDNAGNGTVVVTGSGPASGITLSNIVNPNGTVTGDLIASCNATADQFTLTATDTGGLTATSTLNVTVAANTPPLLGTYSNTTLTAGGGTTVVASAAPSDNGNVLATGVTTAGSFTGTLSINPATGDVTIANAAPAGVYTVEVIATDNCNQPSTRTFQLTVNAANAAPTITAATGLSRQQGSPVSNSTIATVTDDAGAGTVVVTGASTVNGITLSNIVNTAGTVTGNLIASCTATNAAFTLTATDAGSLTATSTLNVTAAANTPPVQGTYADTVVTAGGGATVAPSVAPSDNGSISSVLVNAPGFTGTLSVNPSTGVVTIANAGPAATYTVTVTANDNCFSNPTRGNAEAVPSNSSTRTFQLTVNAGNAAPTITAATGLSRQQGSPVSNSTIATVTDDAGNGTVVVTGGGTVNGITLSNIVNNAGTVTGDLIASCSATNAAFTLTATDGGNLTSTSTLNVAVVANTPPVLGTYPDTTVTVGGGATVLASAAPSDNGILDTTAVGVADYNGGIVADIETGTITITNANPAGVYRVNVNAIDTCVLVTTRSFQLTVTAANTAPTITAAAGLSRQQGSPVSNSTIATVTDDGGAGTVVVTGASTVNGITLSNIVNTAGSITGNLIASCTATDAAFTLTATDAGSLTATSTLNVTAAQNTSPVQGTYAHTAVTAGGGTTVSPNAAPSDNGTVTLTVSASVGFTGTLAVNNVTGQVTVSNAGPASVTPYKITVIATDNCGATSPSSFNLTVNQGGGDPAIVANAVSRAQGSAFSRSVIANATDAAGAGNVVVTVNGGATALFQGVEIKAIQNANGVITAAVRGGCFSPTQVQFTLTATSTSGSNTATLPVNVTPSGNPNWCAWWPR